MFLFLVYRYKGYAGLDLGNDEELHFVSLYTTILLNVKK